MSFQPKVSIVIPVYNGSKYMREAIDSALNQTYRNIEVIVVNDGSRDDGKSDMVAREYGDKIRYIAKENGGVATALNRGIREMTGDYFTWLSHDDVLFLDKTEKQINLLASLPDKQTVLFSDYEVIDPQSRPINNFKYKNPSITGKEPPGLRYLMFPLNPFFFCTMMVAKSCFDESGLFNESWRTTQDYEMCFRLAGKYPFLYMPDKTAMNRVHPEQVTELNPNQLVETDGLVTQMILELKAANKTNPYRDMLPEYFLKLAVNFKKRIFLKAAETASAISLELLKEENREMIPSEKTLYQNYLQYQKEKDPVYWIRKIRKKIKKISGF